MAGHTLAQANAKNFVDALRLVLDVPAVRFRFGRGKSFNRKCCLMRNESKGKQREPGN